jgi:hypothetical protein
MSKTKFLSINKNNVQQFSQYNITIEAVEGCAESAIA